MVADAEVAYAHAQARKDMELSDLEVQIDDRRSKVVERQTAEAWIFESKWADEKPMTYQKSSSPLLDMKVREMRMIASGNIAGAKEMAERIDGREKIEAEAKQQMLDRDYTFARVQLEKKQAGQVGYFEARSLGRRAEKAAALDRELRVFENRVYVTKKHEPTICRTRRSSNETNPVCYGLSFTHLARESGFGMEPILPSLRSPQDVRSKKKQRAKIAPITEQIPRLYVYQNESTMIDQDLLFPTGLQRGTAPPEEASRRSSGRENKEVEPSEDVNLDNVGESTEQSEDPSAGNTEGEAEKVGESTEQSEHAAAGNTAGEAGHVGGSAEEQKHPPVGDDDGIVVESEGHEDT
jgi:hypothetical protein